ncbi:MAG: hypothetical protein QNJ14_18795 [Woeseiaceae bacterium]|nr:hypothetical protein [Woeseiaceae bacterium]
MSGNPNEARHIVVTVEASHDNSHPTLRDSLHYLNALLASNSSCQ